MGNLTGQVIGKYRVDALLGRGGMGEVYRGHHSILGREVAIKTIYPHLAEDERFLDRFQQEARLAASLRHPNIVQLLDFDVENGMPYMVMEFISGPNLKERLGKLNAVGERMAMPEVLSTLHGVASALDYAHGRGVIHRDIKASNILTTDSGDPVLADFGLARLQETTQVTATGAILGTPAYLSPEQGRGEKADARSDIYSLGVVLYEMITGCLPFAGDSPSSVIMKHLVEEPPSPLSLRPDLPAEAEQVCLKALAKGPDDRFQTAQAIVQALRAAMLAPASVLADNERTVPGTQPASGGTVGNGVLLASPATERGEASVRVRDVQPQLRRGAPWRWIVASALLLAVVSVVAMLVLQADRNREAPPVVTPGPQPLRAAATAEEPPPTAGTYELGSALPAGATSGFAVDNAGPDFTIVAMDWGTCAYDECEGAGYPPDFRYAEPGCTDCEARFDLHVPTDGTYDVWAWWPKGSDRATDTPYTIQFAGGRMTVNVDQRNNGNRWYWLARKQFRAGAPASITVRGSTSGYANADAVALTLPSP